MADTETSKVSLNPILWGPDMWTVLFETCYAFEQCRHFKNVRHMSILKRFLYILADLFLCEHCGKFYNQQLVLYADKMNLIDWIYDLKNLVTLKIYVTKETTHECNLKVCPLVHVTRIEFYNRLLYHHNAPQKDAWNNTINLIRAYYSSIKVKESEIKDFNTTLDEMIHSIPYFKDLVLDDFEKDSVRTHFIEYMESATIQ